MPDSLLPIDPKTLATDLCENIDLGEEAEELLKNGQTADEFFVLLQKNKLFFDAIRILANVLHKLYAIEWACASVRWGMTDKSDPDEEKLVAIAEKWLEERTEANRRAAMVAAEENEYELPASWASAAVGWSCGSLAAPELPVVPPGDDLTAKAAGGAVSMVAVQNSGQIQKRAAALLEIGLEFAARPIPESLEDETFKVEPAKAAPPSPTPEASPLPTPTPTSTPAPKPAPAPVISPPPSQFAPAPARPPRRPPPPDEGGGWVTKPL